MQNEHLLIISTFTAYFALHSLLASLWLKQRVARCCPGLLPYYRLGYNLLAVVLAVPLLYLLWRYPGEPLWQWQGFGGYLADGLGLLTLITLLYSLRLYDMGEFLGLRQAHGKVHQIRDMEHFQISPLHRYVRHPWYFLILVIIWSRDVASNQLLIYLLVTLYLVIGSRLEERKLIAYHGEVYREYRRRVAGLIPLPWKTLSQPQADALLSRYRQQ
ncbi:MAG TPA: hypothetical protein VIQ22_07140 [Gammaproteobacteria bacterium]